MSSDRRTLRGLIRRAVDRHLDVDQLVYIRPAASGEDVVRKLGCTEPIRVASFGDRTFAPGSIVTVGQRLGSSRKSIIAPPPPGQRGASRFPVVQVSSEIDFVTITGADPEEMLVGATDEEVQVFGGPFIEDPLDTFEAIVPGEGEKSAWPLDPLVTISGVSWVSSSQVTLTMSVSSSAPVTHKISLRVSR